MLLRRSMLQKSALASLVMLSLTACNSSSSTSVKNDDITQYREKEEEDMVKRGSYLVTAAGCNDCHSPKKLTPMGPEVDSTKILSGHPEGMPMIPFDADALKPGHWIQMGPDLTAYVGPWGVSYAANLTPDSTTGIGAWTEDAFIKTIRTGKHLGLEGGRPILPPMPWPEFAKLKDDDLKAIYAYLRSLPPVHNKVPAPLSPPDAAKLAKKM
jgi:mono/diheme cytochrome c family protein